jgi:hypothetical protein
MPNLPVHPPIPPVAGGSPISVTIADSGQPAVEGQNTGTAGQNTPAAIGVRGNAPPGWGVYGHSVSGIGVRGESQSGHGLEGVSHDGNNAAIVASNDGGGRGIVASGKPAGEFIGDVHVTGKLTVDLDIVLSNAADCAEEFDVTSGVEAGTVMVLGDGQGLRPCDAAYDHKVAGVISGAGDYRPGLILDRRPSSEIRMPVALVGKVFCKVDARYGAIGVGDLLTTSATPGHAMRAGDPLRSFGAVIGKALGKLEAGQGLIPILVAMQ